MNTVTLGRTGITVQKNAFGALPIQRISSDEAVAILRRAYDGGITFYDTARGYTDSEEKVGRAFAGMRDKIYIATKSHATTPQQLRIDLETSLAKLGTKPHAGSGGVFYRQDTHTDHKKPETYHKTSQLKSVGYVAAANAIVQQICHQQRD